MNKVAKNAKIESFWEWFIDNESRIKAAVNETSEEDRTELIHSIDNQVLEFGMFKWEIGHGSTKPFYLTISPNGSKELLLISKNIIQSAPVLSDWEFNYSTPVKDWNLQFSLFDDFMIERDIDASNWKFILERSINQIKIIIEAANIATIDEQTQLTAANYVITNLVGEECRINTIHAIEVVGKLDEKQSLGFPIIKLKQKIEALG